MINRRRDHHNGTRAAKVRPTASGIQQDRWYTCERDASGRSGATCRHSRHQRLH